MVTNSVLISIPIVSNPEFANYNAVGRPIRPIPTTPIFNELLVRCALIWDLSNNDRFFVNVIIEKIVVFVVLDLLIILPNI